MRRQVDDGAGGLERLGLGVAELDDVGAVAARQRRRQLLDDAGPLLALELDRDVRMDLVELGDRVVDELVGRVAAVEPQPDRLALRRALRGRRGVVAAAAGRGGGRRGAGRRSPRVVVVIVAAGGENDAARRQNGCESDRLALSYSHDVLLWTMLLVRGCVSDSRPASRSGPVLTPLAGPEIW